MFIEHETKALNELAALFRKYEEEFKNLEIDGYLNDALLDGQSMIERQEDIDAENNSLPNALAEFIYERAQ